MIKKTKNGYYRISRNVYLGSRVVDMGKPGLDRLEEVEAIARAILRDFKTGRIDSKTANGRFSRLRNLIIDISKVKQKAKAKKIVDKYWKQYSNLLRQKKQSKTKKKSRKKKSRKK